MDWLNSVEHMFAKNLDGYGNTAALEGYEEPGQDDGDFYESRQGDLNADSETGTVDTPSRPGDSVSSDVHVANGESTNGATFLRSSNLNLATQMPANPSVTEQQKAENQRRADELRAKLIARRQGTPMNQLQSGRHVPASQAAVDPALKAAQARASKIELKESSSDSLGVQSLITEGKAAAEAKKKDQMATAPEPFDKGGTPAKQPLQLRLPPPPIAPGPKQGYQAPTASSKPIEEAPASGQPKSNQSTTPQAQTDTYYADLSVWLEMTGFHNVEYRNSKLRTFKERQALEAEAARIQERLDKLREAEQAAIHPMRANPALRLALSQQDVPPLPKVLPPITTTPVDELKAAVTDLKRAHSPEAIKPAKAARREDSPDGFPVRHADKNQEQRPASPRGRARRRSPGPPGGAERCSPEARRNNIGVRNKADRDESLERRHGYHQPDHPQDPRMVRRDRIERQSSRDLPSGVPKAICRGVDAKAKYG